MKRLLILVVLFIFLPKSSYAYTVSGYDFPVGKPDAENYYDAQGFNVWNSSYHGYHLGEDWNGGNCADCDLGDPVYSISEGKIDTATSVKGWGNVVMILHGAGTSATMSLYGHLQTIDVAKGQLVTRGQRIGTIGKGYNNGMAAHLHFEIRTNIKLGIGQGYGKINQAGYTDPTSFINSHRPPKPVTLSGSWATGNAVKLNWTAQANGTNFSKYEIYRSTTAGGTTNIATATKVTTITDPNTTSFSDTVAPSQSYYYSIYTYITNGLSAQSNEISILVPITPIQITNLPNVQRNAVIANDHIYYENYYVTYPLPAFTIDSYNLVTKSMESHPFVYPGPHGLGILPDAQGKFLVFSAAEDDYNGSNVYGFDASNNYGFLISKEPGDEDEPSVSAEGIAVWRDCTNSLVNRCDLYMRDINTLSPKVLLAGGERGQSNPRIWGDYVTWKEDRSDNNNFDLHLRNIKTNEESVIATNVKYVNDAPVWQNYVTWNDGNDLKIYDINSKITKIIQPQPTGQPNIRDGKVVYCIHDVLGTHLHVYDIVSGTDRVIEMPGVEPDAPYIYGNVIAFHQTDYNSTPINSDVYIVYI